MPTRKGGERKKRVKPRIIHVNKSVKKRKRVKVSVKKRTAVTPSGITKRGKRAKLTIGEALALGQEKIQQELARVYRERDEMKRAVHDFTEREKQSIVKYQRETAEREAKIAQLQAQNRELEEALAQFGPYEEDTPLIGPRPLTKEDYWTVRIREAEEMGEEIYPIILELAEETDTTPNEVYTHYVYMGVA